MNAVARFLAEAQLGCLMAPLAPADAAQIVAWSHLAIPEAALANDGWESEIHVTVLFGFKPEVTPLMVQQAVSAWANGRESIRFTLGPLARFDTAPAHDVIIATVEHCDDLVDLNAALTAKFGEQIDNKYPDFRPHLTLAYVRKLACPELNGHGKLQGSTYVIPQLVYSTPDSKAKVPISFKTTAGSLPGGKP